MISINIILAAYISGITVGWLAGSGILHIEEREEIEHGDNEEEY